MLAELPYADNSGMTVVFAKEEHCDYGEQEEENVKAKEEEESNVAWLEEGMLQVNASKNVTKNRYSGSYGYSVLENDEQRYVYNRLTTATEKFQESAEDVTIVAKDEAYPKRDVKEWLKYPEDMDKYKGYAVMMEISKNKKVTQADARRSIVSFLYDHPEYFWSKGYSYTPNNNYVVKIGLQCQAEFYVGETRLAMWERIQQSINSYLKLVAGIRTDYEKELVLHDAIAERMTYAYVEGTKTPEDARWAHTIESVFSGERTSTVCEGYAKAFQLLLNACNIENIYVVGNGNGSGHAWNQVKIDGNWYNVDLTWDDTGDRSSHRYFNVTDDTFAKSHVPYSSSVEPVVGTWCYDVKKCTATEYCFTNQVDIGRSTKYKLEIEEIEGLDVKVYNNGIEVSKDSQVDEETVLEVCIVPELINVDANVEATCGDESFIYYGWVNDKGLKFDFTIHGDCKVAVNYEVPIQSALFKKNDYSVQGYKKDVKVKLVQSPAKNTQQVYLKSSNTKVALVKNNKVISVAPGNAVITAYDENGNVLDKCLVHVLAPTIKIICNKKKIPVGSSIMLDAKIKGSDGDVSWYVSDRKKAIIDKESGIFTAKKTGKIRVYAREGKVEQYIVITIV